VLTVSDDGCGMGQEVLAKMFEPFFTTKGLGQGTGLGLATVHGIVKQNKGFIDVTSEPDKGTTFKIYLPRHTVPFARAEQAGQDPIPRGQGETVLVVDDEAALLELTRTLLAELGYSVLTAASPAEALDLAKRQPALNLLLSDVIMPGMSGLELARALREQWPDMRCLFMSGYASEAFAGSGGFDSGSFIQKPFSARELAFKVRALLGR